MAAFRYLIICFALVGCAVEQATPPQITETEVGAAGSGDALGLSEAESTSESPAIEAIDPALRAAYIRTRQLDANAAFEVHRTSSGYEAKNPEAKLEMRYRADRVFLEREAETQEQSSHEASIRFSAYGRAGAWTEAPRIQAVEVKHNLVAYDRGHITEQYLNGPLGLEQFFTIAERPAGSGEVELVLELEGDLSPALADNGRYVELRDANDRGVMEISELFIEDATGRELSSRFYVRDGRVLLAFDDTDAKYPIAIDPLMTTLRHEKLASDPQARAQFGYSVSVMNFGSNPAMALIGAPYAGNTGSSSTAIGAAYLFRYDSVTRNWTQEAKLVPQTSVKNAGSGFGISVSIGWQGKLIFVGSPYYPNGTSEGRVFVFYKDGNTWKQGFILEPPGYAANDRFGASIDGRGRPYVVVGTPGREVGAIQNAGAAFMFTFGFNTAGLPYLLADRTSVTAPTPAADENFGSKVVNNEVVLISAPNATVSSKARAGRVHVFKAASATSLTFVQTISPPSPTVSGQFGSDVAVTSGDCSSGDCTETFAMISEPGADAHGIDSGVAYVYSSTASPANFTRQITLTPPSTGGNYAGYYKVAIQTIDSGSFLLTRAALASSHAGTAPIAIWDRVNGTWGSTPTMLAVPSATAGSRFGSALALNPRDAAQLIAGAPLDDQAATDAGRAYFYDLGFSNGMPCGNPEMCKSGFCNDGVCCNVDCSGGTDCQACSISAGGTTDGTCTALRSNISIVCRAGDASQCRADTKCSTSSRTCPSSAPPAAAGTTCRAAVAGGCDVAETCNGSTTGCPANAFQPRDTVCRSSLDICNPWEVCSGTSDQCPPDVTNICL